MSELDDRVEWLRYYRSWRYTFIRVASLGFMFGGLIGVISILMGEILGVALTAIAIVMVLVLGHVIHDDRKKAERWVQ